MLLLNVVNLVYFLASITLVNQAVGIRTQDALVAILPVLAGNSSCFQCLGLWHDSFCVPKRMPSKSQRFTYVRDILVW